MLAVALVGADGAGKTTIARQVTAVVPRARYLYMGVNLEASHVMLPSTRLVLEIKRAMGGRPDLSAPRTDPTAPGARPRGLLGTMRAEVRYANQIAEEWFRQLVAWYYLRRGSIVIFDRHFLWDYDASFSDPGADRALRMRRLHDRLLRRLYPRPDLIICLDAPAEVLHARKGEGSMEDRERRRREYLEFGARSDNFVVIDVDRPPEVVIRDVADTIARSATAKDDRV